VGVQRVRVPRDPVDQQSGLDAVEPVDRQDQRRDVLDVLRHPQRAAVDAPHALDLVGQVGHAVTGLLVVPADEHVGVDRLVDPEQPPAGHVVEGADHACVRQQHLALLGRRPVLDGHGLGPEVVEHHRVDHVAHDLGRAGVRERWQRRPLGLEGQRDHDDLGGARDLVVGARVHLDTVPGALQHVLDRRAGLLLGARPDVDDVAGPGPPGREATPLGPRAPHDPEDLTYVGTGHARSSSSVDRIVGG
jgi:hypothetical protein